MSSYELILLLLTFALAAGSCLSRKLKIDDPLDAFGVHGACGFFGVIAVGLFTIQPYSYTPNAGSPAFGGVNGSTDGGIFSGQTRGALFGAQVVCALIEVAWVATTCAILFGGLRFAGLLRVDAKDEVTGMRTGKLSGT